MIFYHPFSAAGFDQNVGNMLPSACPTSALQRPLSAILTECLRDYLTRPFSRKRFARCVTERFKTPPGCTRLRGVAAVPKVLGFNFRTYWPGSCSPEGLVVASDIVLMHPDTHEFLLPRMSADVELTFKPKDIWLVIGVLVRLDLFAHRRRGPGA